MPQPGDWPGGWGQRNGGAPCVLRASLSFQVGSAAWDLVVSIHPPMKDVLGWGVRVPAGVPLTPLCLPAAGKPPKPYGGALGALGFRGEHGAPCPASASPASPVGCGRREGSSRIPRRRSGLRGREVLREEAEVTLRHPSPHELWCYCMVQNVNPKQS